MAGTILRLCLVFLPFLVLISKAQGERRARSFWRAHDKLNTELDDENQSKTEAQRSDGLIYAEASSNYASSRGDGLNINQGLTQAEGRGGPVYAYLTDDLRNKRASANIVTQLIFTTVGWIGMYFAWPLLRGNIAGKKAYTASLLNPLLFDIQGFGHEEEVNRQGDDDFDPLNILDFNFSLEQVLTRIGINTGWAFLNYLLWVLLGKLPDVDA